MQHPPQQAGQQKKQHGGKQNAPARIGRKNAPQQDPAQHEHAAPSRSLTGKQQRKPQRRELLTQGPARQQQTHKQQHKAAPCFGLPQPPA